MTIEKKIQVIVERNILYDPTCESKRKLQKEAAIRMISELEELLREPKPYEPRSQFK